MTALFYIASAIAIIATCMVITRTNAVHALLYLLASLLAIGVVFLSLGAAFVAALEVIIYAGAIMVLFVFVIMMLNLGPVAAGQERIWLTPRTWIGPGILSVVLLAELVYTLMARPAAAMDGASIPPQAVGRALFTTYLLAVELAALVLLAGLVGAYHLGRQRWLEAGDRRPEAEGVLHSHDLQLPVSGLQPKEGAHGPHPT